MSDVIKEAVVKAAASLSAGEETKEEETVETVETAEEETTDDEDKESEESDSDDDNEDVSGSESEEDDEEEVEEPSDAEKVWAALQQDPAAVVNWIAQQANLDITVGKTAKTEKQAKAEAASINEILAEELGDNYKFLADRIGTALEKILVSRVDSKFQEQAVLDDAQFVENKMLSLAKSDGLGKKSSALVFNKMSDIFKRMPGNYSNKKELDEYIDLVYSLASQDVKKVKNGVDGVTKRVKQQKQNLEDEDPPSVAAGDQKIHKRPKDLTHRQAVEAAMKGIVYAD